MGRFAVVIAALFLVLGGVAVAAANVQDPADADASGLDLEGRKSDLLDSFLGPDEDDDDEGDNGPTGVEDDSFGTPVVVLPPDNPLDPDGDDTLGDDGTDNGDNTAEPQVKPDTKDDPPPSPPPPPQPPTPDTRGDTGGDTSG
ncbi:MAG: hypothetical protein ABI649_01890 [Gaiellaceae bacterium]